jgi:hypothetical protein
MNLGNGKIMKRASRQNSNRVDFAMHATEEKARNTEVESQSLYIHSNDAKAKLPACSHSYV